MRELVILPAAEAEMAESYDWYEKRLPGLGSEFLLTVEATFERIAHAPQTFLLIHKNLRRVASGASGARLAKLQMASVASGARLAKLQSRRH